MVRPVPNTEPRAPGWEEEQYAGENNQILTIIRSRRRISLEERILTIDRSAFR